MSLPKVLWEDLRDECPVVSELARHLRAKNKNGIATCLAQLKSDAKLRKEFSKQASNLGILVQFLRCQNHAMVNMSLSILADACLAFEVREKVRGSEIGSNVVLVIKNLKLDARLHCRACRLVSNLSECSWHAKELYNVGVVETLAELLKSKTSTQTYCMAVRAVRNIWSFYEPSREKMVEHEIVKLVTQIFVTVEEKSDVDAKCADLMDACLKAMCAFLGTLDPRCGIQMQVEKDKSYRCLIRCCSVGNNKMGIKCLYSLCQIAECRLLLGISGAVERLIALINSKHLHEEVLVSLCMFCRESVNRDRIKDGDGLQLILELLKKPEHERYHPVLLQALAQFIYDDIAIDILVKHGIAEVLVAKLLNITAIADSEKSSASRKRYSDYPPEALKTPLKYGRSYSARFSMDFYRNDWSPKSTTSASSSSPPGTPPLPICSDSNAETDDTEDDIYSPICSDTECGDYGEEDASVTSYKSTTVNETDSDALSPDPKIEISRTSKTNVCEYHTLLLLSRLSLSLEPIDSLVDPTTIKALITYIKYAKVNDFQKRRVSASKILMRIMRNAAYFVPLLKQGLVFEVQSLPEKEEYARCLRVVAETGGAVGHLSFMLLRGDEQHKLLTAVSIPLLIRTHHTLQRLLNKYGGLQLILRLLTEPSHELHERAIWSICQLAKSLKIDPYGRSAAASIANPGELGDYSTRLSLDEAKSTVSSTVTFELDDGTTVEACRRTLCRRSDVFSAMLDGNFSESGKKRVRLRNTSRDGLNTLISATSGATAFRHQSIESLLDAVLLADKFLMPELSETLTETSMAKLSHENFCRAWCWARKYSCHELRSCCVRSFLVAQMSWGETVRTFRDFRITDAFDEFLREIRETIVGVLCQFQTRRGRSSHSD